MKSLPQNIRNSFAVLRQSGQSVNETPLVIGGFVRDWILGMNFSQVDDFDVIAMDNNTDTVANDFARRSGYSGGGIVYDYSGTTLVYNNGLKFEFQSSTSKHVHFDISNELVRLGVEETPLTKNIYERDFTINTLCYDVMHNKIIDVTGVGVNDLCVSKTLRTPIAALQAINNNPFILLRMVRFQIQFGLQLDEELARAVQPGIQILKSKITTRSNRTVSRLVSSAFNLNGGMADKLYTQYGLYDAVGKKFIPKRIRQKELFDSFQVENS